jgi:hypothetical protein
MNPFNNFSNEISDKHNSKRQKIELKDKSSNPNRFTLDFELHDDKNINSAHDKWYTEFNRLLYSRKCIYFYIFLILSSVVIFIYSLVAYFLNLGKIY